MQTKRCPLAKCVALLEKIYLTSRSKYKPTGYAVDHFRTDLFKTNPKLCDGSEVSLFYLYYYSIYIISPFCSYMNQLQAGGHVAQGWNKALTFVDMLGRGGRGVEKGEEEEREERPCSPLGHHFSKINLCRLQEPRRNPVVNPRPPPAIHSQDEKFKVAPRKCKETSETSYF